MWWILLGFVVGFGAFKFWPWSLPLGLSPYIAIAILAGLDSVVGAARSSLEGQYDERIFVSGFFTNAILAVLLGYMGDILGVNLVLAAEVAFGVRIFQNLGRTRRNLLARWQARSAASSAGPPAPPISQPQPDGSGGLLGIEGTPLSREGTETGE